MKNTLLGFIDFLFGLILALLGLRVLLKLFGASATAPFVHWTYEVTQPLLVPFVGAFPAPVLRGGFVIEFTSLFGMLIYALVGYLLLELVAQIEALAERRRKISVK